jgi:imidazoleglycerol-phosphate dehydratase/histidinol-phosphatase
MEQESAETGIAFWSYARPNCASRTNGLKFVKGDLEVDEHHTIEDTAIALGEVLRKH